jgi:hypothetical protein
MHFGFRWLATPRECREYRDLSWIIAEHKAGLLGQRGWVPDLVIIDYALTQNPDTVAKRLAGFEDQLPELSPLPALKQCAADANLDIIEDASLPPTVPKGNDTWGCFVGGMIMTTFADHPCAPVTVTRYSRDPDTLAEASPDAAFFEWLMEAQSGKLLRAAGQVDSPKWREVLVPGVMNLRKRISALVKAGIVQVLPSDLVALSDNAKHPVLTIASRYGPRRYPVKGLFADVAAGSDWDKQVQEFAKELLDSLVDHSVFEQATLLAQDLWEAYVADESTHLGRLRTKRWRLSELTEGGGVANELGQLRKEFQVTGAQCGVSRDLRAGPNNEIRRWAVVLVVYQLAIRAARLKLRINALEWSGLGDPSIIENDLWCALFPLPKDPFTLPDRTGRYRHTNWEKCVSSLQLRLPQVIEGSGFDGNASKGLKRGERYVLRCMALGETDLLAGKPLEESILWECLPARLILWGRETDGSCNV